MAAASEMPSHPSHATSLLPAPSMEAAEQLLPERRAGLHPCPLRAGPWLPLPAAAWPLTPPLPGRPHADCISLICALARAGLGPARRAVPCASSALTEPCSRGLPPRWLPRPAAQRCVGGPSQRPVLLESLGPGRGPLRSRGLDGSPSCLRVSESALPVVSLVGTGGSTGGEPEAGSRPPPTHCPFPGPHPRLWVPAPSACWSEEVPWGPRGGQSVHGRTQGCPCSRRSGLAQVSSAVLIHRTEKGAEGRAERSHSSL